MCPWIFLPFVALEKNATSVKTKLEFVFITKTKYGLFPYKGLCFFMLLKIMTVGLLLFRRLHEHIAIQWRLCSITVKNAKKKLSKNWVCGVTWLDADRMFPWFPGHGSENWEMCLQVHSLRVDFPLPYLVFPNSDAIANYDYLSLNIYTTCFHLSWGSQGANKQR